MTLPRIQEDVVYSSFAIDIEMLEGNKPCASRRLIIGLFVIATLITFIVIGITCDIATIIASGAMVSIFLVALFWDY